MSEPDELTPEEIAALRADQRNFWRLSENMKGLRALCEKGAADGWQHLPISTVAIYARDVAAPKETTP